VNELCRRFADEGVWIRPMGRVVYLCPPFVVTDAELAKLTRAVAKVVGLPATVTS
jgi:adenosylmethionine-8-amino-7-oxononanoate aminotransferase